MTARLSAIARVTPQLIANATLTVETRGAGFTEAALGTWQGIYLVEHRRQPHRREVVLQFIGSERSRAA